jgi:hypothetical protein
MQPENWSIHVYWRMNICTINFAVFFFKLKCQTTVSWTATDR